MDNFKLNVAKQFIDFVSRLYGLNPDRKLEVRALDLAIFQSHFSIKQIFRDYKQFLRAWGIVLSPTIVAILLRPIPLSWLHPIYAVNLVILALILLWTNATTLAGYYVASNSPSSLRVYYNWTEDENTNPHDSWARQKLYHLSRYETMR